MAIVVKINGLEKLTKLAEKFPDVAEKYVGQAINKSLVRVFGEEKKEAPVGVSAQLRDRWNIKLGKFSGIFKSGVPYGVSIHEGTRPHYVPPAALAQWARTKGLNPYAVSKSIQKKGTKANPFLERAVKSSEAAINLEFQKAIDTIAKEVLK